MALGHKKVDFGKSPIATVIQVLSCQQLFILRKISMPTVIMVPTLIRKSKSTGCPI